LKIEVKKKIDVIFDFRPGKKWTKRKPSSGNAFAISKQDDDVSKKPLMLAGFVHVLKKIFISA
jgi:hypothetical protein